MNFFHKIEPALTESASPATIIPGPSETTAEDWTLSPLPTESLEAADMKIVAGPEGIEIIGDGEPPQSA
jgi:hypothetical protein